MCVMILVSGAAAAPATQDNKQEISLWKRAGFTNPRLQQIDTKRFYKKSSDAFTHRFDLTVVMFRETGWTKKAILKRLKKVAGIYARCGVMIGKLTVVTAGAPEGRVDFARPGRRDKQIALRVPPSAKPIFFYFRSIPEVNAYAWPRSTDNDAIPDAIRDTAWFSLSVTMPLNKKIRHPGYVSEAHELGHILLDTLAHTPEGQMNLMAADYEHVNDQLTPEQCRKIKNHPLVKPID